MFLAEGGTKTDTHIILTVELVTNYARNIDINALLHLDKVQVCENRDVGVISLSAVAQRDGCRP